MRLLRLLAFVAACDQGQPPAPVSSPPPVASAAAAPSDAGVDAGPPTQRYASVSELLGLAAGAPGDRLAGYQLGHPADATWSRIEIPGWWVSARAVVRDGKVAHVVVELAPDDDDAARLDVVRKEIVTRWGAPRRLVAKDHAALAASVTLEATNDMAFCGDPGDGETYARCAAALLPTLPAAPECHVSGEVYYWRTVGKHHGGAYFVFSRSGSTWKASGPIAIGHDDDPNPTAP